MSYDRAIVTVEAEHEKAAKELRELVDELHNRYGNNGFAVNITNAEPLTNGSSASGGTVFTVEVDEYAGEIPLFTAKVRETIVDAEIVDVDVNRGASKLG